MQSRLETKAASNFFEVAAIGSLISIFVLLVSAVLHGGGTVTSADFDFPGNIIFNLSLFGTLVGSAALWIGMSAYLIAIDRKTLWLGVFLIFCLSWVWVGLHIYYWFIYAPRMRKLHRQLPP